MSDQPQDPTADVGVPRAVVDIEERPCELCGDPVTSDERWEVLRADGPVWRHPWHTEPV